MLRAGAGLIAATRFEDAQPTWFVTGTDARRCRRPPSRALDESALTRHFALASPTIAGSRCPRPAVSAPSVGRAPRGPRRARGARLPAAGERAARRAAPIAAAYCGAIAVATLVLDHPLALVALGLAIAGAARGARVGQAVARAARPGAALALFIVVMNPLAVRDGLTVLARLGRRPRPGRIDVTLEAVAYGGVLGLRALVLVTCFGLATAAVDPDEVLRAVRRVSFHAALTATLATQDGPGARA